MSKKEKSKEKDVYKTKEVGRTCNQPANFAGMETISPNWHKLLTGEDFVLPGEVYEELLPLEQADLNDFWNGSYGGVKRKTR